MTKTIEIVYFKEINIPYNMYCYFIFSYDDYHSKYYLDKIFSVCKNKNLKYKYIDLKSISNNTSLNISSGLEFFIDDTDLDSLRIKNSINTCQIFKDLISANTLKWSLIMMGYLRDFDLIIVNCPFALNFINQSRLFYALNKVLSRLKYKKFLVYLVENTIFNDFYKILVFMFQIFYFFHLLNIYPHIIILDKTNARNYKISPGYSKKEFLKQLKKIPKYHTFQHKQYFLLNKILKIFYAIILKCRILI